MFVYLTNIVHFIYFQSTWRKKWNINHKTNKYQWHFQLKQDMCLLNTDAPGSNSQNMAKISKSYILTLPHPQGHVMSVKCEEPIDELTVQVW